jgi:isocitrate dehydrogenase (NAD+)
LIRENTEGEYSGLEHETVPGVVESLKVRAGSGEYRNRWIGMDPFARNCTPL